MKISIVTVTYNAASTIADTVRSVVAQDHDDYEHIIVDGCSTDDTLTQLRALAHPRLVVISEPDDGIYDAMNRGLQRATGDLIGFLNADDFYCRTDALSLLAKAAEATSCDAVAAGIVIVDPRRPDLIQRAYPALGFRPWMLRLAYMPPHPGFYARREAAGRIGLFNTNLRTAADFDWIARFHQLGMRAALQAETLVAMRSGGASHRLSGIRRGRRDAVSSMRANGLGDFSPLVWVKYLMKVSQFRAFGSRFPAPEQVRWRPSQADLRPATAP